MRPRFHCFQQKRMRCRRCVKQVLNRSITISAARISGCRQSWLDRSHSPALKPFARTSPIRMTSPPIDPSRSDSRLRLAIRFEWMVALAITLVVVWLDVNYARHAGALWRDEANSLVMATYPSLKTTWDRLRFDSFPMLWYVVLRGWVRAGLGQTDTGLRAFGLLVNVGILAILWLNAWRMSRRPPVVALTLLGTNAA